ncbi:MAG: hypothetical protein RJB38_2261 [Pseudomonadota bacterium]|jgi:hypothetical protein
MTPFQDPSVSEILAASIAPVTLITGVAFLTSIMAPRFGRCIDRIRSLLTEIQPGLQTGKDCRNPMGQLEILYRRTRRLQLTMSAAGVCILFVVLTITSTFANLFFGFPGPGVAALVFVLALTALVVITLGFIRDFLSSLSAVELEIEAALHQAPKPAVERILEKGSALSLLFGGIKKR